MQSTIQHIIMLYNVSIVVQLVLWKIGTHCSCEIERQNDIFFSKLNKIRKGEKIEEAQDKVVHIEVIH